MITWLTADSRDNGLLDLLNVTEKELRFRRGLLDPIALNARWSKTVCIFQNGRPTVQHIVGRLQQLENVCRFTWAMTLIVAALDVALTSTLLEAVVVEYSAGLFKNTILDLGYLRHEIPIHISGWRSASITRTIAYRARSMWAEMEGRLGHHLPGFVPEIEKAELVRFLLCLTTGSTPVMMTSSSDLRSLASLLSVLGFDGLKVCEGVEEQDLDLSGGDCALIYRSDRIITPQVEA